MKKGLTVFLVLVLGIIISFMCFSNKKSSEPNTYYQVYLDGSLMGTIKSKNSLEKYINSQAEIIRDKVKDYENKIGAIDDVNEVLSNVNQATLGDKYEEYNKKNKEEKVQYLINNSKRYNISDVKLTSLQNYIKEKLDQLSNDEIEAMKKYYDENKIYLSSDDISTPNGIDIKKVFTYQNKLMPTSDMYSKIVSLKNCTIPGYKFTITDKKNNKKDIYVTDKDIFESAINNLASIFIGEDEYNAYKNDTQSEIETTGNKIENVYVDESITYKEVSIPTDETIYTDATELSQYLLYGDNYEANTVTVNAGDSISSVAFNNKISVQEFLISNPEYTSEDNLLYQGKKVVIAKADPQISIVEEAHSVQDVESNFGTVEVYDSNMTKGDEVVTREGEKGLDRITQNVKSINGEISYVEPVSKETLKASVDKEITVGTKVIPNVGSTSSWGWPTNKGYTISSGYGYRLAVFGEGDFHSGIDIAGTGYGSPVYATNNGVIVKKAYASTYGNHIIINHNNGFYTLYGHMAGFAPGISVGSTVSRGQTIGYVGSTGWATGPHLHYEIRTCERYACVTNPLNYY